ncbi:MAG: hypothetical protein A4E31_00409 [Methanomassiliicoccales archaeon PtaU1.Bin030]|nr:MAG: hypothetical protein A4E31_00409 [Methanomassiliicoccales archaeon PtaU1.Bin030]
MAASPTGANASVLYGFELTAGGADNFGSGANLVNKAFGYNLDLSMTSDRSMNYSYGPGSRNWQSAKAGKYNGTWKGDFDLCDPWILETVIGPHGAISGSSGSYAATFSESDSPSTMEIDVCKAVVPGSTYSLTKYYGCSVKEASFGYEAGSDEPIRLSLSGEYSNEALSAPSSFTSQTLPDQAAPIIFANVTVATSSNGTDYTTISHIDKLEVKIDNDTEHRWAGGSDKAVRRKYGERMYDISLTKLFDSSATLKQKLYGNSTGPTASNPTPIPYLKVTLAAEVSATMSWIFTNVYPGRRDEPTAGPKDELTETVDLRAQSCSVVLAGWDTTEPSRY